jgi:steroid delta-isomerase-like uncharacterized protein
MTTAPTIVAASALLSAATGPQDLRQDQHKTVARTEIERFEGANDAHVAKDLFSNSYRLHFGGQPPLDLAGHQQVLAMFRAAFPDLRIAVLGQVAHGDRVANHFVMRGTQKGEFNGLPATGKHIVVTGTNLMRFEGGRIAETWGQIDMVGLMQQLGAMPGDASTPVEPPPEPVAHGAPGGKDAVKRFVDAFNRKEIEAIGREFSAEYVLDFPGGPRGQGVDGVKSATAAFISAFPDLQFSIDDLIEEGDRVVWRWTMRGTQKGALGPILPTDKPVTLTVISLFRIRGGKIAQDKVRADMMGLLAQLGAIPRK